MKIVNKALAIAVMLLASFSVSATTIDGVTWNPDHVDDFNGGSISIYQEFNITTGILSGYGYVHTLNDAGDFCSGCELTFHFGDYKLLDGDIPLVGLDYFTGGSIQFYVDHTPELTLLESLTTSNLTALNTGSEDGANALWLDLDGHIRDGGADDITFIGVNGSETTVGVGGLNVVGGLAADEMVPNTKLNVFSPGVDLDPILSFSDFSFGSTFSVFDTSGVVFDEETGIAISGIATAEGGLTFNGQSIPEPSSLAIFGLGLIALAFGARNKEHH